MAKDLDMDGRGCPSPRDKKLPPVHGAKRTEGCGRGRKSGGVTEIFRCHPQLGLGGQCSLRQPTSGCSQRFFSYRWRIWTKTNGWRHCKIDFKMVQAYTSLEWKHPFM